MSPNGVRFEKKSIHKYVTEDFLSKAKVFVNFENKIHFQGSPKMFLSKMGSRVQFPRYRDAQILNPTPLVLRTHLRSSTGSTYKCFPDEDTLSGADLTETYGYESSPTHFEAESVLEVPHRPPSPLSLPPSRTRMLQVNRETHWIRLPTVKRFVVTGYDSERSNLDFHPRWGTNDRPTGTRSGKWRDSGILLGKRVGDCYEDLRVGYSVHDTTLGGEGGGGGGSPLILCRRDG